MLPVGIEPRLKRKLLDTGLACEVDRATIGVEVRTPGEVIVEAISEIDWLAPMVLLAECNTQAPQPPLHLAGIEHYERLIGCHCRIMNRFRGISERHKFRRKIRAMFIL